MASTAQAQTQPTGLDYEPPAVSAVTQVGEPLIGTSLSGKLFD